MWPDVCSTGIDLVLLLLMSTGDPLSSSISNGTTLSIETKKQEETVRYENEGLSSSPSSYKDSITNDPDGKESPVSRDPLCSGQKAYIEF